jgi:deoxycytidylate deaminase
MKKQMAYTTTGVPIDQVKPLSSATVSLKFKPDIRSCAKQEVIAVIVNGENYWYGSNWCAVPQQTCPRGDLPSGVGYDRCINICKQSGHAEMDALAKAGNNAKGATVYIIGHTYCCDDCKKALMDAGVKDIIVGRLPAMVFQVEDIIK